MGRKRFTTGLSHQMSNEAKSDRQSDYAYAADRAAARLNQVEEAELRQTGALPDWFFDAVEEERKAYRSRRRR